MSRRNKGHKARKKFEIFLRFCFFLMICDTGRYKVVFSIWD